MEERSSETEDRAAIATESPLAVARSGLNLSAVLGILLGAISLISVSQRIFDVGLAPVFADFIDYYRRIAWAVFGYLPSLFSLDIPGYVADLWALSFVGARALVLDWHLTENRPVTFRAMMLPVFLIGISFLGLGAFVMIAALVDGRLTGDTIKVLSERWRTLLFTFSTIGLCALFFLLNANLPVQAA